MLKRTLLVAAALMLGLGPALAHADTIQEDGATYTLNYSVADAPANSYYVQLTVDTTHYTFSAGSPAAPVSPNYLQAIALELDPNQNAAHQPTVTLVSAGTSAGFTDFQIDKDGNGGCGASSTKFFCVEYAPDIYGAPAGNAGDIYYFDFLVTLPTGGTLDFAPDGDTVQANYNYTTTGNNGTIHSHNGDYVNDSITLTPTPEPSSLALLGTGVLGAAGLLRRRLNKA